MGFGIFRRPPYVGKPRRKTFPPALVSAPPTAVVLSNPIRYFLRVRPFTGKRARKINAALIPSVVQAAATPVEMFVVRRIRVRRR